MAKPGRSIPGTRRAAKNAAEIADRRAEVAKLYLQGKTFREIGRIVGVSVTAVSFDMKANHRRWAASIIDNYQAIINRELERLDLIESKAWIGWEKSLANREEKIEKAGERGLRTSTKTSGQCGNPGFLQVAVQCHEKRCKLLGLDDLPAGAGMGGFDGTRRTPDQDAADMDTTIPAVPVRSVESAESAEKTVNQDILRGSASPCENLTVEEEPGDGAFDGS